MMGFVDVDSAKQKCGMQPTKLPSSKAQKGRRGPVQCLFHGLHHHLLFLRGRGRVDRRPCNPVPLFGFWCRLAIGRTNTRHFSVLRNKELGFPTRRKFLGRHPLRVAPVRVVNQMLFCSFNCRMQSK